jgi:hypothetical protein
MVANTKGAFMSYEYEIEVMNRRFGVNKPSIQESINFYFSRYFMIDSLTDPSSFISQFQLEKMTKLEGSYLEIPLDINFVQEGGRQIWIGVTNKNKSPISQREHTFGYIDISPVKFNSAVPTDVKILCGWPPLYFFFYGMAEHLINNFENEIYRSGVDSEKEILLQILAGINNQHYILAELYELVNSLRRWALAVQKTGLPMNKDVSSALEKLSKDTGQSGGVKSYLEVSLPFIPGILTYKFEFGTEHDIDLNALYIELEAIWEKLKSRKQSFP